MVLGLSKMKNLYILYIITVLNLIKSETVFVPDQFSTIQEAIDFSSDSDSIIVSAGVYFEQINFQGKSLVISSRYQIDNDTLLIGLTVIDAGNNGSVVTFDNQENDQSILQGFTIQNGIGNYEDPDDNGTFYNYGGGIYCKNSDPTIKNCVIKDNSGNEGGGGGVFCYNSSPKFFECTISSNITDDLGGGVYARVNSSPEFYDCLIIENEAEYGGGCYFRDESNPILQNTSVENNLANNSGGGMSIKDDADLIVLSSSISNNETDGIGGGVYITNASPSFEFVLIANNSSSSGAGAYIRNESNVSFSNLTLVNNVAALNGNAIYLRDGSNVILNNSIIWENEDLQIYFRDSGDEVTLDVTYSTIQDGLGGIEDNNNGEINWGMGNIYDAPLFCNSLSGNYYLRSISPCIDAGIGGSTMGCYESDCESIVWFIDTQGSDLNDGSLENPFESIERAIDASINGDTIRLNPGNYFGPINFDGKDIVLESRAFELNDTSLIRDTQYLPGPNGNSCLTLSGNQNNGGTLRGLTFRGGSDLKGGGIKLENCSPTLSDLIFEENNAENGGGLYLVESDAVLKNLLFKNNTANYGGGLYIENSEPYIQNLTLDNNISYWGGGAYFKSSNTIVQEGKILNNESFIEGGGIYIDGGSLNAEGISFEYNNGFDFGGAISATESIIDLNHSTFVHNISGTGSVFSLYSSIFSIRNSILWDNSISYFYAPAENGLSSLTFEFVNMENGENSINTLEDVILENVFSVTDQDPLFCDFENKIFTLRENSPCRTFSESGGIIGAYLDDCEYLSMVEGTINLDKFKLSQNYPNPFNPDTKLDLLIPKGKNFSLKIYDINGVMIKNLKSGIGNGNILSVKWDATNSYGKKVSSGFYTARLYVEGNYKNINMVYIK